MTTEEINDNVTITNSVFFHHFASSASDTATRCTACPSRFSVLSVRIGNARRSPRTRSATDRITHHRDAARVEKRRGRRRSSPDGATHTVMSCPTASHRTCGVIAGQRRSLARDASTPVHVATLGPFFIENCSQRPRVVVPTSPKFPTFSKVDIPLSPAAPPEFSMLGLMESQRKDASRVAKPIGEQLHIEKSKNQLGPHTRDTNNNGLGQVATSHTFGSHPAIGRDGNSH